MTNMIQLAKLWQRTSTNSGKVYYGGLLGDANVLLFKNDRKDAKDDHDLTLFIAPQKPKPKSKTDDRRQDDLFGRDPYSGDEVIE